MCQLNRVVICAAFFGLLATSPEAFSQQKPNKSKGADASTDININTAQNASNSSYNWNGFYGGGNLGGSFGGSDFLSALGAGVPFFEGESYPGVENPAIPGIIAAYRSNHANVSSFSGGVNVGYNFLVGSVLLGAEIDVDVLSLDKSKTTYAMGFPHPVFDSATYTFRNAIDTNYIATLRPRVGLQVNGALLYVTGGVAMTTLKYEHDFTGTGGFFATGPSIVEHASVSQTLAGWTVGGGAELPIGPIVSLRAEYLFTEFRNVSTSENKIFPLTDAPNPPDFPCGADTGLGGFYPVPNPTPRQCFDHKANLDVHRFRLGINFKI